VSVIINPFRFAASGGDPNWSSVVYLSGFEPISGSSVRDESSFAHAATFNAGIGSFGASTAQAKFGTQSLHRPPTGSGLLTYADSADWAFGSSPYTVECWVYFTTSPAANISHLFGQLDTATSRSWALSVVNGVLTHYRSADGSTNPNNVTGAWAPSLNTWYHLAADFDGTKARIYAGGVMKGSSTTAVTLFNATCPLAVGSILTSGAANSDFDGYLDEVRITKGVARYASDAGFTPPTAAFPRS
jgi:hypothetical protein